MRLRSTAAAGLITTALFIGFPGTAQAADRDCPDFPTQAAAQAAFDAVPGDPERLDEDDDGIACETLPGGAAAAPTSSQVAVRPAGAVAAGDGSSAETGSPLPYVLGGLALAGAGGAALAARRSNRSAA
jgi:hypothetical protein